MAQNRELQWCGAPVARAKAILPAQWDYYKADLFDLYRRMTLDELKETMKLKYGFDPSRRQYISQFEKWGLRKAKSLNSALKSDIPRQPLSVTRLAKKSPPAVGNASNKTSIVAPIPVKRLLDVGNATPKESKRRHLLNQYTVEEKSSKISNALEIAAASKPDELCLSGPHNAHLSLKSKKCPVIDERAGFNMIGALEEDMESPQISHSRHKRNRMSSLPVVSNCATLNRILDKWICKRQLDDSPCLCLRETCSPRHANAVSDDEIEDMQCAADVLFSMQLLEAAFPIYLLIWQKRDEALFQECQKTNQALLACIRSCYSSSQVLPFRFLQRMQSFQQDEGAFGRFASNQLKAGDFSHHSSHSMRHETILSCCPSESVHTSLPYKTELLQQQRFGILGLGDQQIRDICLQSCLNWCLNELMQNINAIEEPLSLVLSAVHHKEVAQLMLYCYLWELWQLTPSKADAGQWSAQTSELMGISPSEHLHVICWMIIHESHPTSDGTHMDPFSRYSMAVRSLLRKNNAEIGKLYINCFRWKSEWSTTKVLSQHQISPSKDFRTHTVGFTNESDTIMRLEVDRELSFGKFKPSINDNETLLYSSPDPGFVVGAPSPTLASPLSSVDLASFRAMRDRIKVTGKSTPQDAKSMTPSRVCNLRNKVFSSSIDELSLSMTSSLRISQGIQPPEELEIVINFE